MPAPTWRVGLAAFVWALLVPAICVQVVHDGDPTGPFLITEETAAHLERPERVRIHTSGYDGQFFLVLARDPWLRGVAREALDLPHYRARRILWPALAWFAALGDPERTVVALYLWNALFVALGSAALAELARGYGAPAWWGGIFALSLGTVLCLWRMLGDAASVALLLCALVALQRRSTLGAGALLGLAVLARETALLAVPLVLLAVAQRGGLRAALGCGALALGPAAAWYAYSGAVLAETDRSPLLTAWNFDLPLRGLAAAVGEVLASDKSLLRKAKDAWVIGYHVTAIAVAGALAARVWRVRHRSSEPPCALDPQLLVAIVAIWSLLAVVLGHAVWWELWGYARALLPLPLLLFCWALAASDREPATWRFAAAAPALAGAAAGAAYVVYLVASATH